MEDGDLHVLDRGRVSTSLLERAELAIYLLREIDVHYHLAHLVQGVGAALNFQLLQKELLVTARDRHFVEKTVGEELFGLLDEGVAAVEKPEETDDLVERGSDTAVIESLVMLDQVFMRVFCDEAWREGLLVHKLVEC